MTKPKILKIKVGYNPNSSSIGTLLKAFPMALYGSAVLFNLVISILLSGKFIKMGKNKKVPNKPKKANPLKPPRRCRLRTA